MRRRSIASSLPTGPRPDARPLAGEGAAPGWGTLLFVVAELGADVDPFILHLCASLAQKERARNAADAARSRCSPPCSRRTRSHPASHKAPLMWTGVSTAPMPYSERTITAAPSRSASAMSTPQTASISRKAITIAESSGPNRWRRFSLSSWTFCHGARSHGLSRGMAGIGGSGHCPAPSSIEPWRLPS
jgi:hypothetical protein